MAAKCKCTAYCECSSYDTGTVMFYVVGILVLVILNIIGPCWFGFVLCH